MKKQPRDLEAAHRARFFRNLLNMSKKQNTSCNLIKKSINKLFAFRSPALSARSAWTSAVSPRCAPLQIAWMFLRTAFPATQNDCAWHFVRSEPVDGIFFKHLLPYYKWGRSPYERPASEHAKETAKCPVGQHHLLVSPRSLGFLQHARPPFWASGNASNLVATEGQRAGSQTCVDFPLCPMLDFHEPFHQVLRFWFSLIGLLVALFFACHFKLK